MSHVQSLKGRISCYRRQVEFLLGLYDNKGVEVPVNDLHLGGTESENPEPLLRSSSIVASFRVFPSSFSLTSVVRITLAFPELITKGLSSWTVLGRF